MAAPVFFSKFYIQRYHLYCDWDSYEQNTDRKKKKYKLFVGEHISQVLDEIKMFVFIVSTSKSDACIGDLTTKVTIDEWERKDARYLTDPTKISHLDISKIDIVHLDKIDDLYQKYTKTITHKKVSYKEFEVVATMPSNKITEMRKSMLKIRHHAANWTDIRRNAIQPLISLFCDDSGLVYHDTLKKLGLA